MNGWDWVCFGINTDIANIKDYKDTCSRPSVLTIINSLSDQISYGKYSVKKNGSPFQR